MRTRTAAVSICATVALLALPHVGVGTVRADRDHIEFTVDVAVDHGTFAIVPSMGLVLAPEAAGPNRGTPFIVDGTIFPGGTLQKGAGMGDPHQPGAIGAWICKGIFTSDLGTADIGFNTTQMFQFDGD